MLLGVLATAAGAATAVRFLLGWDWMVSLVFGALVAVTADPPWSAPRVRQLRLRPRVAAVLEAEGVLIDPVGALLAVLLLGVALAPSADSLAEGVGLMLSRVGLGVVAGAVGGFLLARLLRIRDAVPEGLENIVVLASILLLFQGCNELQSESGLMAVTVAGVVMGNLHSPVDRDLREFKDQLTVLLVGLLFVLLAASVGLDDVLKLGLPGLVVVSVLILVVRPLSVWMCTAGSDLSLRARMEGVGTVVGLTQNQMLNGVFVSRTRERFSVPSGYVAANHPDSGLAPELVQRQEAEVLFDGPHEVERWDVRTRHGGVEVENWVYVGVNATSETADEPLVESTGEQPLNDRFVVLTIRRGTKTGPMHASFEVEAGDVAAIAIYSPDKEQADEELRTLGWKLSDSPAESDEAE